MHGRIAGSKGNVKHNAQAAIPFCRVFLEMGGGAEDNIYNRCWRLTNKARIYTYISNLPSF